jgi:hypothetical protein
MYLTCEVKFWHKDPLLVSFSEKNESLKFDELYLDSQQTSMSLKLFYLVGSVLLSNCILRVLSTLLLQERLLTPLSFVKLTLETFTYVYYVCGKMTSSQVL